MAADPILLTAGRWLLASAGLLAVLTLAGFLSRWGIRFRLVGVTSFTTLLAISCLLGIWTASVMQVRRKQPNTENLTVAVPCA